jgi:cytochrome P450
MGLPAITPPITPAQALAMAQAFDLRALDAAFLANPYPVYDALRQTRPVAQLPDGSFFLTRHADLVTVYRDAQSFYADKHEEFAPKYGQGTPLYEHHTTSLVFNDPPLHTRVRGIIMGALTRRAIADLAPGLRQLVDDLLNRLQARGGGDLIDDFASAIPVEIIGNLLAVPHADRGPLREWSLAILGALEPTLSAAQLQRGQDSVRDFTQYLRGLVAHRRAHPLDPQRDVLTRLIAGDANGQALSETELLQNCIFLLNAGHETTTNLIGNALVALCEWPQVRAGLLASLQACSAQSPEEEALMVPAVDEFLRFESSNQLGNRRARTATELGGVALPQGARLTLCIGAANRDPEVFAQPHALDLQRQPNRHLAFGFGTHQCAGLSLARLEGMVALSMFLRRFPRYALSAAPTRGARARFRGFLHAPFTTKG